MLKELIEKVDEKIYEQVFLGKLSITKKLILNFRLLICPLLQQKMALMK